MNPFSKVLAFVVGIISASTAFSNPEIGSYLVIIESTDSSAIQESSKLYQKRFEEIYPDTSIVVHNVNADKVKLNTIIDDLIEAPKPPILIISVATLSTRLLYQRIDELPAPVQFMVVADPFLEKISDQDGQPSKKNITGFSHRISIKTKFELLEKIISSSGRTQPVRLGVLYSEYPSSKGEKDCLLDLVDTSTLQFTPIRLNYKLLKSNPDAFYRESLQDMLNKPELDGVWITSGPISYDNKFVDHIRKNNIPIFYIENIDAIKSGALLGVISSHEDIADFAIKQTKLLINGTPANAIPITRIKKVAVFLNASTAIQQNLPIPSNILRLASGRIYQ